MVRNSASASERQFDAVEAVIAAAAEETYTYRGTKYAVHPAAHIFPLLAGERYRELLEHCKENGVLEPVRLFKGAIADGRNRVRVAIEADLDLEFEELSGDLDPCRIVAGRNLMRRDMMPEQRSLLARTLRDLSEYYFYQLEGGFLGQVAEETSDPVSGEVLPPAIGASNTPGMGAHDPLPVRPSAAPSGGPVAPQSAKGKDKSGGFEPTPSRATPVTSSQSSAPPPVDGAGESDIPEGFLAPMSTQAAADSMGVSTRDVRRADELAAAVPDLVDAVKEGVVSIREALDPEVKAAPEEVRIAALAEIKNEGGKASLKQAVQRRQQERGVAPGPKKKKSAPPKGRKAGSAVAGGITEIEELPDLTTSQRRGSDNVSPADDPATPYEVYSPSGLVMISRVTLGGIDLDPASSEEAQLNVEANKWFGVEDDGLNLPWKGTVYCFPPPNQVSSFADKLGKELMAGHTSRAVFVAPTQSGPEWAQKLFMNPALALIVVMRGDEPLVMEPIDKGVRPGVWRPSCGLTAFIFGVEATAECCDQWAVWGLPFVVAPSVQQAA